MANISVEANYFKRNCWVTLFCVFFLLSENKAQDNNIRQTLPVLPSEVYPKMISMIPAGEWGKLNDCFQSIEPLFSSIDQEFNTVYSIQLQESIKSKNKGDAMYLLTSVAVYGIIGYLDDAINMENSSEVKVITRASFTEFLAIEKQFKKRHFNRCQRIVMLFRRCYSSSTDAKNYEYSANELIRNLKYLVENHG